MHLHHDDKLPKEVGKWWVTSNELHERLIYAGVHPSLRHEIVQDAIRRLNGDTTFLASPMFFGVNYYRSLLCHQDADSGDIPSKQRFKNTSNGVKNRMNINPKRDYFKTSEGNLLRTINEAIEAIIEEEKSEYEAK